MEEKRKIEFNEAGKPAEKKKLTYEELSKALSDVHVSYQKLMAEYRKAVEALQSRDFDYTSFFLQMLFKVVDHPEMYKDEFVKWCVENIQDALTSFAESIKVAGENPEENKDEAE